MNKEAAIIKVKLLFRLASSAPENEAANAKQMATNLIEKFALLPEEYEEVEEKPIYTDDELLFETIEYSEWQSLLAVAVAHKYDCSVIQEENVSSMGDRVYKYFVYGENADVVAAKMLFSFVKKEIDTHVSMHCRGRGELYISSYCEGLVNGVRINIETEDFHIEGMVKSEVKEEPAINKEAIVKNEESKKEPPIKERVKASKKEKPLDIIAYFTGEGHGRKIHIGKVMDELMLAEDTQSEDFEGENDSMSDSIGLVNALKNLFK